MTVKNFIEILIISYVLYQILVWFKNTKAWTLLKGILFILGFFLFAAVLQLDTILWLLEKCSVIAVTAILIIFQPELRRALEQLGSQDVFGRFFQTETVTEDEEFSKKTIHELVRASFEMGKARTGALMVLERENSLMDIERTGIAVDGIVTSQLLINIFEHNTPLHDGAVVIRGNRVSAATCYLPLSENMTINKALGTRHRAAVGISESTDSVTIVVSEETGRVSAAIGGSLRILSSEEELANFLQIQMLGPETRRTGRLRDIWKRKRIR
ncbi:diadenylate cyclase CdaA [Clostridium vitabionis]|uniref:diadenylate cyclase CdaA n=1 Tax=Clostridium vitabionis TaxID=2784388 RepID=UPI0038B23ADC